MVGKRVDSGKRQRDVDSPLAALAAHGERFMQMFEDSPKPASMRRSKVKGKPVKKNLRLELFSEMKAKHQSLGRHSEAPGSISSNHPDNVRIASKKQCTNEIEEIMHQAILTHYDNVSTSKTKGRSPSLEEMKQERRAFMSCKAGKVHSVTTSHMPRRETVGPEIDPTLTPEEFKNLQMEVERLGASALDKKQRKKWQAQFLQRLGAKAEKAPRTPARIGFGMAKKQAQREARAQAEAIASGVIRVKGMGKKKQALKDKQRDRGLMEAGTNFKNGILKVANPMAQPQKGKGSKRSRG